MADQYGSLGFVFNNAGVGATLPFADASHDQWDRVLSLNLRAVIDGTAITYRIMTGFGTGHIVHTASVSGLVPVPMQTLYNTAKFGVVGLSTTLRTEAAAAGVRVSVVCPGNVSTPIWATPVLGPPADSAQARTPSDAMSAEHAAQAVLHGVAANRDVIVFPRQARHLARSYRHFPRHLSRWLIDEYARRAAELVDRS